MFNPSTKGYRLSRLCAVTVFAYAAAPFAMAGGYLAVDNTGQPYKWQGPIPIRMDLGPLGKLDNAGADALVIDAVSRWSAPAIPNSAVVFQPGADLSEDHGDGVGTDPNFDLLTPPDGITAVIYDQKGLLIDQALGQGQSRSVVGFAGPTIPDDFSPAPINEGIAVLNGRFYDGDENLDGVWDLDENLYRGTFIHEFGHLLNLTHSQAALQYSETGFESGTYFPGFPGGIGKPVDYRGLPTMFPLVLPDIRSLELDDIAWICQLYPGGDFANYGSISGVARTFAGQPFNGANVIAFSADDPTSMITCVTGYTDANPMVNGTGTYRLPGLPPGSSWVVDVEPVYDYSLAGTSVGRVNPPPPLAGAPEFLNELGVESATDPAVLSTAFKIPSAPANPNINTVDLRFGDINEFNAVQEAESNGTITPANAQLVPVTPGKYTVINGHADPNDPGKDYTAGFGTSVDVFVVDYPAGLELNALTMVSNPNGAVDVWLMEQDQNGDLVPITGTGQLMGDNVSLYMDSSRLGSGAGAGKFFFVVVYPESIFGGGTLVPADYSIGVIFSVGDRDALVVKGAEGEVINPNSGTIRILGRGFKNLGGPPSVQFSAPGIKVNGVTYINSNTLDVAVERLPEFQPGSSTAITVTNHSLSGGYSGRRSESVIAVPVHLSSFALE